MDLRRVRRTGQHRDQTLRTFQWVEGDWMFYLRPTLEGNLWKIWKVRADEQGREGAAEPECVGHLIVYVDDLMTKSGSGFAVLS